MTRIAIYPGSFDPPTKGHEDLIRRSLALADRTLGELRAAMESAGLWDRATILISSDHPYREAMTLDGKSDPRIPFLLKLAGAGDPLSYGAAFNTVLSRDLLIAILNGKVDNSSGVADWLDRRRTTVSADAGAR